jgi:hypothetical protein
MTNPGEKVRREASPFSSSVGVRKIMNHFVVIDSWLTPARALNYCAGIAVSQKERLWNPPTRTS